MATPGQISARQQIAAKAIAERLTELFPEVEPINIPIRSRYGVAVLIATQLETLSNFLNRVDAPTQSEKAETNQTVMSALDFSKFSVGTLESLADDLKINVEGTGANGRVLKSDYVKALENANANG